MFGLMTSRESYGPRYVLRRLNIESMQQEIQERELERALSQLSADTTKSAPGPAPNN